MDVLIILIFACIYTLLSIFAFDFFMKFLALFIILFVIVFIATLSARIHVVFDGKLKIYVKVFGIKILRILPSDKDLISDPDYPEKKKEKLRKKAAKSAKKKKIKAKKKAQKKKKEQEEERKKKLSEGEKREKKPDQKPAKKKKITVKQIFYFVKMLPRVLSVFIKRFGKALHIKLIRLKIKVGTDDAAKTAELYGAICAGLSASLDILSLMPDFKSSRKDIDVFADFLSDKIEAEAHIVVTLRVHGILASLFKTVFAALVYFLKHPFPKKQEEKSGIIYDEDEKFKKRKKKKSRKKVKQVSKKK